VKAIDIRFEDKALDLFLYRWMNQGLTEAELREWKSLLLYNREFREELCDFLKTFREQSWIRAGEG
jgi:hypothetical protein